LVLRTSDFVVEFARKAGLLPSLRLPEQLPKARLAPALRHAAFSAVKEFVHNVVKHAQATRIELVVSLGRDLASLTIEDNGVGIGEGRPLNGGWRKSGLVNAEKRLHEVGGTSKLQRAASGGMEATITIPVHWEVP